MDNYHEDLIVVLEELKLHHLEQVQVLHEIYDENYNYHLAMAKRIQSELDRLAKKYS